MNFRCPKKKPGDWIDLAVVDGTVGREDCQAQWQLAVANYLNNCTLLDVGAGLCESKARMSIRNITVTTQEPSPGSPADIDSPLTAFEGEWDAVTSFDVLEHVDDPVAFLKQLSAKSRRWVAVSTPNYLLSHNSHRFHVREYCPDEIVPMGAEAGLTFEMGWAQLPGRGVFSVGSAEELAGVQDTHGFCVLFRRVPSGLDYKALRGLRSDG